MPLWPEKLFDLVYFPGNNDRLDDLASISEIENWDYQNTPSTHHKPVLYNYLQYSYRRLNEEEKITVSDDGSALAFNTGLVTPNQEELFCYCTPNRSATSTGAVASSPWYFTQWCRTGEHELTKFSQLPHPAHYFDNPSALVLDPKKELRTNIEHIVNENKVRFPTQYSSMTEYALQTLLKGAIDNAKSRVRRNYKAAVPHYYKGRVQLLLPICLADPQVADLAIVIEDQGLFYRATTCLTLDMAYNNARLLARPDRDWLSP